MLKHIDTLYYILLAILFGIDVVTVSSFLIVHLLEQILEVGCSLSSYFPLLFLPYLIGFFLFVFLVLRFLSFAVFEQVTMNAVRGLWARRSRLNLVGAHINVFTGEWTQKVTFL